MSFQETDEHDPAAVDAILGTLNFSSGGFDRRLYRTLDQLAGDLPAEEEWDGRQLKAVLLSAAERLAATNPAFADLTQAHAVLELTFERLLPEYLSFHQNLLFHQSPGKLFNSFLVGRFLEAVLQQGGPWDEADRIVGDALHQLNDYVGHRPLATLENRKLAISVHEKLRPVPLYIAGAGVAGGPYHEVVEAALEILRSTDQDILEAAELSPELLDELAYDPRSYDFDHPVNRRPNYHFGQWDPHCIDERGFYRRFVVQQVTLDALTSRATQADASNREEMIFEAGAVLAGTMLMAAGISGRGPGALGTEITLTQLLTRIARYRDEFYDRLLSRVEGGHGERLREEAQVKRQSFGAARQHINAELARQRARQIEHVHLARVFARMGFLEDAIREANVVPVASARMSCLIDCALVAGHRAVDDRQWSQAQEQLSQAVTMMHEAIECGALIDPWNILGFDAHFSLFHGMENSVHDHRADELIALVERILELASRIWDEASAAKKPELAGWSDQLFRQITDWWHPFATHEVSSVEGFDAANAYRAARHVAECLSLWNDEATEIGDVAFWASHAERFDSPTAYALVIEALFEQGNDLASRGLLMHWLGQADQVPLEHGNNSYFDLAYRWMVQQLKRGIESGESGESSKAAWSQVAKWFDYLEANAGDFWRVPEFRLEQSHPPQVAADELASLEEDEDDEDNLFGAAYENVTYQDSTDDGIEGAIYERPEGGGLAELELESKRIGQRLMFLAHLAKVWKVAGLVAAGRLNRARQTSSEGELSPADAFLDELKGPVAQWVEQASANRLRLDELLRQVQSHPLRRPAADHESMLEYDRQRLLKENLLDQVIGVSVETEDAHQTLLAVHTALAELAGCQASREAALANLPADQACYVQTLAAIVLQDRQRVAEPFEKLCAQLAKEPLLYVPLAKGGDPDKIVASRVRRMAIQELLVCLPRLGLIESTHELLELAREMEQSHPVGQGAVTEFDELFKIGYRAMVEAITQWSHHWEEEAELPGEDTDEMWSRETRLFLAVERLAERCLVTWLEHSKTLRLSVLEKVRDREAWEKLVDFIQAYGGDLFSQRFFNLGNLRAILHQGVRQWLDQLIEDPCDYHFQLLDALDKDINKDQATYWLTLVLEAIIENYVEYRDYNSTTTQSDRGEMLYTLLDFLRLRIRYDRVAWHLRPVVWSHEILVRQGCERVARRWRRAVRQRIGDEPDRYIAHLARLQSKYAMQMPSIADRVNERFLMPMRVDRLRAFVEVAMHDPDTDVGQRAIESLRWETKILTSESTSSGLEVPNWLAALEDEVDRVVADDRNQVDLREAVVSDLVQLSESDLFQQLARLQESMEEIMGSEREGLRPGSRKSSKSDASETEGEES